MLRGGRGLGLPPLWRLLAWLAGLMLSRSAHLPARLPMRARVQLEEGENLEVGHYMERAWAAVFGVGDLNVSSASLCRKWVRDNGGFEGPLAPKPLEGEAAKRGAKRGNATRAAAGPATPSSFPRPAPPARAPTKPNLKGRPWASDENVCQPQ